MPEPKKQPKWWEGITTKEGWQGFVKQKEPLPEPQWFTDFRKWFMGRNLPRPGIAPTPAPTYPGAPTIPEGYEFGGWTPGAGGGYQGLLTPKAKTPEEQQAADVVRMEQERAQIELELLKQQLGGAGAGGQVPQWVTANQQAVMRTMARQYQGMEEQITKAQQSQMQSQWELQRQQMLGQLNEPQDWIKRWMLEQRRNPYKPRIPNPEENVRNIKAQITTLGERGPEAMGQWPYFLQEVRQGESPTSSEIVNATIAQREAFESQKANLQRQLAQEQDVLSTWAGPETRARPKTPPTPPWLAQWYPQQLEVGQPIRNLPIATPSMQWWQQQPESARQGWLGFAEYSGGIPMDILSEMQRQLTQPKQPRQRSTARQRTWV